MKGVVTKVLIILVMLAGQALAGGVYTGSDGKTVEMGSLPEISVISGKIAGTDLAAVLEANFKTGGKISAGSNKVGLPTYQEFERLVEELSASVQGKELAEKARQEAEKKGWGSVSIGQKGGDYYSVAVVDYNGKAIAAQIICNSQVMLASTGPDKAMEVRS
ncbi:MAG TPA: hypothetical protein P5080_04055 [Candidatus Paceibacterota bacterium]|nr:hypothetical protein [Candidatus Pacearchaeota archaeon]HRZ51145.1 hypothetical protein [Candidatus Paceibacterota bacterium]HSA36848.1 hypothetical protein [Candidatus Paceibacterota bacterium]